MRPLYALLLAARLRGGAAFRTVDRDEGEAPSAQAACTRLLDEIGSLGDVQREQVRALRVDEAGYIVSAGGSAFVAPQDDYHAETHVALTLPRSLVPTALELKEGQLSHFMKAPEFLEYLGKQRLRTSALFIFALFVLYQTHARGKEHADPVWQAWLDCAHARSVGLDSLTMWSESELEVVEDERMIITAREFRDSSRELFEKLMRPLTAQFPDFFPKSIGEHEFMRALQLASAHRLEVSGVDGEAIAPLVLREAPHGNVLTEEARPATLTRLLVRCIARAGCTYLMRQVVEELLLEEGEEVAEDEDAELFLVNLVATDGAPLPAGRELVIHGGRKNDFLMMEAGYIWDDVRMTSVPLRMWLGEQKGNAPLRRRLLRRARLNETQDFELRHGGLPAEMWLWGRITLCDADEIDEKTTLDRLRRPMSMKTEQEVMSNMMQSMEGIYARYDHNIEEDEYILTQKPRLGPRERMAVTYRKLAKQARAGGKRSRGVKLGSSRRKLRGISVRDSQVLVSGMENVAREYKRIEEDMLRENLPAPKKGSYSTKAERNVDAKKRRKKKEAAARRRAGKRDEL